MDFGDCRLISDNMSTILEYKLPLNFDTKTSVNIQTTETDTLAEIVSKLTDSSAEIKTERKSKTAVKEVKVVVPNKVVEVTFEDGSTQKAICHEADTFSMERAIEICVMKQIMGGSAAYNNAIRKALKVWDTQEKLRIAKEEEEKRIAKRRARYEAYKKRCQEKKLKAEQEELARKREESIEMQKEAFVRAFKEIARSKKPDNFW